MPLPVARTWARPNRPKVANGKSPTRTTWSCEWVDWQKIVDVVAAARRASWDVADAVAAVVVVFASTHVTDVAAKAFV